MVWLSGLIWVLVREWSLKCLPAFIPSLRTVPRMRISWAFMLYPHFFQLVGFLIMRLRTHSLHVLTACSVVSFCEPLRLSGFEDRSGAGLYVSEDLMVFGAYSTTLLL